MPQENLPKPEIEYPCPWDFKIIGTDEDALRVAVADCLKRALSVAPGQREFELSASRSSVGGKYVSLRLNLMVMDEAERNGVFHSLAEHAEIRMVL